MTETEFDTALVTAAFRLAGEEGWRKVNVVAAARAAGLSLVEARARFPSAHRDPVAVRPPRRSGGAAGCRVRGTVRDRLFDLLMRRFDVLQAHRAGVKALLRTLPTDPPTALLLACATQAQHALDAAGRRRDRDRAARRAPGARVAGGVAVGRARLGTRSVGRLSRHDGSGRHRPAARRTGRIVAARPAPCAAGRRKRQGSPNPPAQPRPNRPTRGARPEAAHPKPSRPSRPARSRPARSRPARGRSTRGAATRSPTTRRPPPPEAAPPEAPPPKDERDHTASGSTRRRHGPRRTGG